MIAVVSVEITAANVSMPLFPWRAFRNSYSSVRVRNVPRKIGKWNITNVTVQVTYPDGSIKTADAVLTGGVWVATLEGTATAGTSLQGYKILASGIDENGQPVSNYCLGRGDVTILEDDGELIPENVITYTRLLSAEPTAPKDGDLWQISGSWYIYQDGAAYPIGDDSGLIQQLSAELSNKADISSLTAYALSSDLSSKQDKLSDIQISTINFVVDELATIITFDDNTTSSYNWIGEVTMQTIKDEPSIGWDDIEDTWGKRPKYVKLGNSITSLGNSLFLNCFDLTNIIIPNSVTNIGFGVFEECRNLINIELPDKLTKIDLSLFANCVNLKKIVIPDSVNCINDNVFYNCQSLSNVIFIGKDIDDVQNIEDEEGNKHYPWEIQNTDVITTWNDASQEWVKDQSYLSSVPSTYKTYNDTLSSLSSDGYATTTYAVHNLSGVANITSMPLSSYEAISATADAETLYVITED